MNRTHSETSNVLLIPRREVELISFEGEPSLFFIWNRKKTCANKMDIPSVTSKTGISSGIRSVIVLDEKEGYIKLKGVKPYITYKEKKYGGGLLFEGENEIEHLQKSLTGKKYIGVTPFIKFQVGIKIRLQTISRLNIIKKETYTESKNSKNYTIDTKIADTYDKYKQKTDVFGFKITADTRLDEIIYTLTSNRHQMQKRKEINNLLVKLCENGATAYCKLLMSGAIFDSTLKTNTNIHIGNIVNYDDHGLIKERIVDLGTREKIALSKTLKEKFSEAAEVFYSFRWDFEDAYLFSTPYMKYKHFSNEQRRMCSKAFYDTHSRFLKTADKNNLNKKNIPEFLDSIKTHKITKEELDHYIADKVIYQ